MNRTNVNGISVHHVQRLEVTPERGDNFEWLEVVITSSNGGVFTLILHPVHGEGTETIVVEDRRLAAVET